MESSFSPREIVSELDKFIIGQTNAKKAVAVALRNRWRRKQLPDDLKEEILPKNILDQSVKRKLPMLCSNPDKFVFDAFAFDAFANFAMYVYFDG